MIHPTIIEALGSVAQTDFRMAARALIQTGVLQAQVELEKRKILSGFHEESPEDLAKRIVEARTRCAWFEGLIQVLEQEGSKFK